MELASKREGNCNVMITGPTNHMISIRDHSHDLVIWSRHVTYELDPDIKASLILTSPSPFVQTSSYHRFQYPHHRFHIMTISGSLICHTTTTSSRYYGTHCQRKPRARTRKTTSRSTPGPDPVVVAWEGFSSIAINKSYWREPQGKWWAGRLAGRSISPTF